MALGWAHRRRFTDIFYYGCDMGGVGYYDDESSAQARSGRPGQESRWEKRWEKERKLMKACRVALSEQNGPRLHGLPE
jgi:hypothetical protein